MIIKIIQFFTQKYTITDLSEKYYKQISQNQLKFGILIDEAKKAMCLSVRIVIFFCCRFVKIGL
jgi:hypothetical protein